MAKSLQRQPQKFTVQDYYAADLPEKIELWHGVIGPYSDDGKRSLLANWGADEIIRLTGLEVWREALDALERRA
jgi:hypothetical protein